DEQRRDEPDVDLRHFPHVGLRDRAGHGEHARDRRRLLADSQVDGDDDPELNGIDAHGLHERHHHRHDEDDRRRRVKEEPQDQEEHVQEQQHHPLAGGDRHHRRRQLLRRLDLGEMDAEQRRGGDEQHHYRRLRDPIDERDPQVVPVQLVVDARADHDRGHHGQRRFFGGRDYSPEDPAEDYGGHDQRPGRFLQSGPDIGGHELLLDGEVELAREVPGDGHHEQPTKDARKGAGDETLHHPGV